jgi:hypothetical protein
MNGNRLKQQGDPKRETDGGKLRLEMDCAGCRRGVWGVFAWHGDVGVFTCRDGHRTAYQRSARGWVARAVAAV